MSFSPLPVGTAGSPNTNVITVQGITAGTPMQIQGVVSGTAVPTSLTQTGSAGTPNAAVLSVQGVSGGTNLPTFLATGQSADIGNVGAVSPYHNVSGGQPNALNILSGIEANTASPIPNIGVGPSHFAPAIITISNVQTQILTARTGAVGTGRVRFSIMNTGSVAVTIGATGVVANTTPGWVLPSSMTQPMVFLFTGGLFGITASSTSTVQVLEEY